jgi:hypothetical protein
MVYDINDVVILRASGKGTTGIKLRPEDEVIAFELARSTMEGPEVVTAQGRSLVVRERKFGLSKRGGRGRVVLKRGQISTWTRGPVLMLGPQSAEEKTTKAIASSENSVTADDEVQPLSSSHDGDEE